MAEIEVAAYHPAWRTKQQGDGGGGGGKERVPVAGRARSAAYPAVDGAPPVSGGSPSPCDSWG